MCRVNFSYVERRTGADARAETGDRIRVVIKRLASIGLLPASGSRSSSSSRQPAFIQPILPGLLAHLHPQADSPLPSYTNSFLPAIFLPLPASTLAAFVQNLLQGLPSRLSLASLEPDTPSETIHRLVDVMRDIIGPATPGEEAWTAILHSVSSQTSHGDPTNIEGHLRARMIVSWIRTGGEAGKWKHVVDQVGRT